MLPLRDHFDSNRASGRCEGEFRGGSRNDYKNVDAFEQLIGGGMMEVSISRLCSHHPSGSYRAIGVGDPVFTVPQRRPVLRRLHSVHIHSPSTQGSFFFSP